MQSLEQTDRESMAVAVSPSTRVSLDDIKANIMAEYFVRGEAIATETPAVESLAVLTLCVIVCKNGFTVVGKSAPADAQNFNADLGMKFAREDAMRQLWPLMGYELRERLYKAE